MRRPHPNYLFLLSHMRSYSSLMSHLLGSSPQIDGYGEMHLRYRTRLSLLALPWKVRQSTGEPLQGQWLLDKILHNKIRSPWRLLPESSYRVIIFLRGPQETLQSLLAMKPMLPGETAWTDQRACDHYVTRLHRLRSEGEKLGRRALYLDAEALLQHSDPVLQKLSEWLALDTPLGTDYRIFPKTGKPRIGDPGAHICEGRLNARRDSGRAARAVETRALREADAAYQRCRAALLQSCTTDAGLLLDSTSAS